MANNEGEDPGIAAATVEGLAFSRQRRVLRFLTSDINPPFPPWTIKGGRMVRVSGGRREAGAEEAGQRRCLSVPANGRKMKDHNSGDAF